MERSTSSENGEAGDLHWLFGLRRLFVGILGSGLRARHVAWALWLLIAAFGVLTVGFVASTRAEPRPDWHPWALALVEPLTIVGFAAPGLLVAVRRPRNPAGWLLLLSGLGCMVDNLAHAYGIYGISRDLAGSELAAWISNWSFALAVYPVFFLFLVFPDGRLPSPRWRVAAWYVGCCATLALLVVAFLPGPVDEEYFPSVPNPMGVSALSFAVRNEAELSILLVLSPFLLSAASLLHRYRISEGVVRQQLKWVALAVFVDTTAVGSIAVWHTSGALESLVVDLAFVVLGVGIAVAVMRHGLFAIDRILSRSLLYGGLTVAVVGLYVATVSGLGVLLQPSTTVVPLVATGLVAVAVQPLRSHLQRRVDRLIYGERDNPHLVLSRLGQRLEATVSPEAVLPDLVDTIAGALRLPYVGIELLRDTTVELVASTGTPVGALLRLPLIHQRELLGHLICAARPGEEKLSSVDRRVLTDVAWHAGTAVHAVRLAADLRHSYELLVNAREEERRRLRRSLHDEFGPTLAGLVLQLGAARTLVEQDSAAAGELLDRLRGQLQETILGIRRIAYQLRPPELDDLGLAQAIRERAAAVSQIAETVHRAAAAGSPTTGLRVHVDLPVELPPLPAAVEAAVYRITTEALSNVARHAAARNCTVRLVVTADGEVGAIDLEVCDDGQGLTTPYRSGIGLASMRERAAEIGGTCTIEPNTGGGTRVHARLPLGRSARYGTTTRPHR